VTPPIRCRTVTHKLHDIISCVKGVAALEMAIIAPILIALILGVIIYSIYFTAVIGVRQAASEGARAAVAGLSTAERTSLAIARATQVLTSYGPLTGGSTPTVTAAPDGTGTFKVTVSYNLKNAAIMRYNGFVPLPNETIQASVVVTNGGY